MELAHAALRHLRSDGRHVELTRQARHCAEVLGPLHLELWRLACDRPNWPTVRDFLTKRSGSLKQHVKTLFSNKICNKETYETLTSEKIIWFAKRSFSWLMQGGLRSGGCGELAAALAGHGGVVRLHAIGDAGACAAKHGDLHAGWASWLGVS